MLCMALALQGVGARLKVYGAAQRRAEMQAMLLRAVDELKTARIDAELLSELPGHPGRQAPGSGPGAGGL